MANQNHNPENDNDDFEEIENYDPHYDEEEYPSEEMEADQYFFGMNEGYTLAKSDPEKVNKLMAEMDPLSGTYDQGIKAGKERYDREMAEQRIKALKQVRSRGKTKELTRSR